MILIVIIVVMFGLMFWQSKKAKQQQAERDATVPIPGEPGKTRPAVPMREKSEDGIVVQ